MHLTRIDTVSLDEGEAAVDLGQEPGDIVVLSFTDSDLAGLADAWAALPVLPDPAPTVRLAKLARLRHPLSVDLYVDAVVARARIVVIRCLGGLDYWRYGIERCAQAARAHGVALAVLPGDDRPDPRLSAYATRPDLHADLDGYLRAGGQANLRALLLRLAAETGCPVEAPPPEALPRGFPWCPACGPLTLGRALAAGASATDFGGRPAPLALVLVYRSAVLGGDGAPVTALVEALRARGIDTLALAVSSLKDPAAVAALRAGVAARRPDLVVAATAFAAREEDFVLDAADCPVLQAIAVGSPRAAWEASARGLGAADLAMHVALPEFDGRLSGFPISFKEDDGRDGRRAVPYEAGIAALAERATGWLRLAATPRAERRIALVLSDYPARGGRAGFAVGLDTPESARAIAADFAAAGYAVSRGERGSGQRASPVPPLRTDGLGSDDLALPGMVAPLSPWAGRGPDAPRGASGERRRSRSDGEGVPQDEAPPSKPPHPRLPPRRAPDEGGSALSPHAGRGDAHATATLVRRDDGRRRGGASALDRHPGAASPAEYDGGPLPEPAALMAALTGPTRPFAVPLDAYTGWFGTLPEASRAEIEAEWGAPEADPACTGGAFRFPVVEAGRLAVFLQPDRGRGLDRKAGYHDPDAPPTHAYLAFHLALRERFDALVQLGTHGTTEWLPGKAVALSPGCWPAAAVGGLPVVYPFIVDDPGEAAPLKRRLGGVALGHLTPEVARAGLDGAGARLRELVEEYAAASVLDPRRAERLARTILDEAEEAGLSAGAGIGPDTPMAEALTRLDAHLCDLGETAFRDGLHVFGRAAPDAAPERIACAAAERAGLLAALDGRFVPPGPAGSPSRGRADVMPTGRNLTTLDPRAIPTRAAAELGALAADAVVTRYLQDEGAYPERVVMDLWASPTLRTGGEDVAHALALMGVRPVWDHASTRVTGFEVLPLALLDRPRIDVTVRVSGAFRDTFPDTLALLDHAARAVAAREEEDADNPLAAARRRGEGAARVYGAAQGYGAGAARLALDGAWDGRDDLARAYLAATGHAFGREAAADPGFAERVAQADAYLHAFDVPERDLLDGDAAVDAAGGLGAAAALTGARPALYSLDVADPRAPRVRSLSEDAARLVRARLAHPAWIAAQLRHGYRGAQELAQGLDAVFVLAATTDAVSDSDLDRLHAAWIGDPAVLASLEAANPAALRAILDRFEELRRRGLWRSRRNSPGADLLRESAA